MMEGADFGPRMRAMAKGRRRHPDIGTIDLRSRRLLMSREAEHLRGT
jgi:hypothetical protein